jgi:hypothetical protein
VLIGSTWFGGRQVERFPDDDGDRDLEQHALVRLKTKQKKEKYFWKLSSESFQIQTKIKMFVSDLGASTTFLNVKNEIQFYPNETNINMS